tara:strand:- start:466 stop:717 length:252 start_codon:yes stop_codon:yes gene_type:complete
MHQDLQSSKSMSPSKPEEHAAGGGEDGGGGGDGGSAGGSGGGTRGEGAAGGSGGPMQTSHALHLHRPLQLVSMSLMHQDLQSS